MMAANVAFASPSGRRSAEIDRMRSIDLVGMKIIDRSGQDSFRTSIKVLQDIEQAERLLKGELADGDQIVSRIFEAGNSSSFRQNTYVFVVNGPLSSDQRVNGFKLYVVTVFKSGTVSTIDYDITEVSNRHLKVINGPRGEEETYIVTTGRELFGRGGPIR